VLRKYGARRQASARRRSSDAPPLDPPQREARKEKGEREEDSCLDPLEQLEAAGRLVTDSPLKMLRREPGVARGAHPRRARPVKHRNFLTAQRPSLDDEDSRRPTPREARRP
jgi:hypothetical protein